MRIIERISPELSAQLDQIESLPSDIPGAYIHACSAEMKDGRSIARVRMDLCPWPEEVRRSEAESQQAYDSLHRRLARYGLGLERIIAGRPDEGGPPQLDVREIVSVRPSSLETPHDVYARMLQAGATGMGYWYFELILKDERRLKCFSHGFFEFLSLPAGVTPDMIIDAVPLPRNTRMPPDAVRDAEAHWCTYTTA